VTDRAVSDVIGYVLVFSLIIATVGIVTAVGFSTIEDRQRDERINNVERAFDVLATNVEDVYRGGAPSRATEIRLAGGTVRHGDSIRISVADSDDPATNVTVSSQPLVYAEGDTEIVYAAGAVIRAEGDSSIMLREPPFQTDSPIALFPLVATFRTTGPEGLSTDGTVRVTSAARSVNTTQSASFEAADSYAVTVESPRSAAWARYFESQDGIGSVDHDEAAGVVEAPIDAGEVATSRFPIRLRISE
jgi:ketosteroid isomerase-like protein